MSPSLTTCGSRRFNRAAWIAPAAAFLIVGPGATRTAYRLFRPTHCRQFTADKLSPADRVGAPSGVWRMDLLTAAKGMPLGDYAKNQCPGFRRAGAWR